MNWHHRWKLGVIAYVLLCTTTCLAQTGTAFSASIGDPSNGATNFSSYIDAFPGKNVPASSCPNPAPTVYVTQGRIIPLFSGPAMKNSDGSWQSVSRTIPSPFSATSSFNTLSISSGGLATTTLNLYYNSDNGVNSGLGWETIVESIDLNTGQYSFTDNLVNTTTPDAPGSCGGTLHATNSVTGFMTVTLSPLTSPVQASLVFVNPAALNGTPLPLASNIPPELVADAPTAIALAADGVSAGVILYESSSASQVTFTLSSPSKYAGVASLSTYSPDYLVNPQPGTATTLGPLNPINGTTCGATQPCVFLGLLYAPTNMPKDAYSANLNRFSITVSGSQPATNGSAAVSAQNTIVLEPPPVVLVHGIWSSAHAAWDPFLSWLGTNYPHNLIFADDYHDSNSLTFEDSQTQMDLGTTITNALATAAQSGVVSQKVDVVAHSMGGLVTRYFMSNTAPAPFPPSYFASAPIHNLITVGTPQNGSPFANFLELHKTDTAAILPQPYAALCALTSNCTLGQFLSFIGRPVGTGVLSLETGLPQYTQPYRSIVGQANDPSITGTFLNAALNAFSPVNTVDSILGTPNDTIVPAQNQINGSTDSATIPGLVHTTVVPVVPTDTGETASSAVWNQVVFWLLGLGNGQAPVTGYIRHAGAGSSEVVTPDASASSTPAPVFSLTGYTQVGTSNLNVSPVSGATLTIGTATAITATSPTKTISELLLYQAVTDPADTAMQYVTQSPFSISFVPSRLGTANFTAIAVFSDGTFVAEPLNYTLQPSGKAFKLILGAPRASLPIGLNTIVPAEAGYQNGLIDVTAQATYVARSGRTNVFSVGPSGSISTTGNGFDWLDVSYGGQTASAVIVAGSCSYSLSPSSQSVAYSGGTATISLTTQSGCSWTADGSGASWLNLSNASGTGSGTVSASLSANTTGSNRTAYVTFAGQDVAIIQPSSTCSYVLGKSNIPVPSTGANGAINVTTSCPITASSSQTWIQATALSASVYYAIAPNTSGSSRSGTITIGDQVVQVTQVAPANTLSVMLSPLTLNFTSQTTGTTSSAQAVTLTNSGTATLAVTSIAASGDFAATNGCGNSVAAGASCTISVSFAPTSAGTRNGLLQITDNAMASPQTVTLSGTGTNPVVTAPAVTLSPNTLTFGLQADGSTSPSQTVMLTNSGTAALTITSIAASGDFAESNTCGMNLAAGGTCTIAVTFTPTAATSRTGTLTITDNATGSPQTVMLSGGGEAVSVSATQTGLTIASPGGSVSTAVQVASLNGFAGTVNLACTVSFQGQGTATNPPACVASPAQVQVATSGNSSSNILISTTAATASRQEESLFPKYPIAFATLFLFAMVPRRRLRGTFLSALLGFFFLGGFLGCGSSNSGTNNPSIATTLGNYQISITATSGTVTASTTVSLNVQ